jgi:micrococcal nuclease
MKLRLTTVLFFLFSALLVNAEEFTGKVIAVADGDTIKVVREEQTIKIRLQGIDCPEKVQPFGMKAKQRTVAVVLGKTVIVQVANTDMYGRIVATIIVDDINLNRLLVSEGLAWWYKAYSHDHILEKLEQQARIGKGALG